MKLSYTYTLSFIHLWIIIEFYQQNGPQNYYMIVLYSLFWISMLAVTNILQSHVFILDCVQYCCGFLLLTDYNLSLRTYRCCGRFVIISHSYLSLSECQVDFFQLYIYYKSFNKALFMLYKSIQSMRLWFNWWLFSHSVDKLNMCVLRNYWWLYRKESRLTCFITPFLQYHLERSHTQTVCEDSAVYQVI